MYRCAAHSSAERVDLDSANFFQIYLFRSANKRHFRKSTTSHAHFIISLLSAFFAGRFYLGIFVAKGDHCRIKINIILKKMRIIRKLFYALAYSWLILFLVYQGLIWAKNYRHFMLRKRELAAAKTVNTPPPSATPYMSGFERNLDRSVILFRLVFDVRLKLKTKSCFG